MLNATVTLSDVLLVIRGIISTTIEELLPQEQRYQVLLSLLLVWHGCFCVAVHGINSTLKLLY